MTLLDASVIIDALRAKDMRLMGDMSAVGGAVCGVTRAEILAGAHSANDRARLITILDGFQQVATPEAMWDQIGDLQAQLRAAGVTVPLSDSVLAAIAISLDIDFWARDSDFDNMQAVLPQMKLYRENP
jgi:predicted nucleic acid-binding protein